MVNNSIDIPLIITAGYDYKIVVWNSITSKPLWSISYQFSHINCLASNVNKDCLVVGGYESIRVFTLDQHSTNSILNLNNHCGNITNIMFSNDNKFMFSCSDDSTARIWDCQSWNTCKEQLCIKNDDPILCGYLSPDSKTCLLGDANGYILIWDIVANKILHKHAVCCKTPISSIDCNKNYNFALVTTLDSFLNIYKFNLSFNKHDDYANLMECQKLVPHAGSYIVKAKFSPNGKSFVTISSDAQAIIWNQCHTEQMLNGYDNNEITHFQCNSKQDTTNKAQTKTQIETQTRHTFNNDSTPTFSKNTKVSKFSMIKEKTSKSKVAQNSSIPNSQDHQNKSTDVYNIENYVPNSNPNMQWKRPLQKKAVLTGHSNWIWDCQFSCDGNYILTGSSDASAMLWNTSTGKIVRTYQKQHTKPITSVLLLDSQYYEFKVKLI